MSGINFKNFVINENATLREAMEAISDNQRGTVAVVDDKFRLVGVLSDGDIRRALVAGRELFSSVKEIVNLNPVIIKKSEKTTEIQEQANQIFNENSAIHLIPVIDKNNQLIDVIIRNPGKRK